MRFYLGLHQPSDARHFLRRRVCISVTRLRRRRRVKVGPWIIDSGAFRELEQFGRYRHSVDEYAAELCRWRDVGRLEAAVAQDWMCEPFMLERTGLTVADHQRLTIERYDALVAKDLGVYVLPVLQGYAPGDYVRHLRRYGRRLPAGAWVGVGSLCKRNGAPEQVLAVLAAVKSERPDLRLHGFGVKITSLAHPGVRSLLFSADSTAWSLHARVNGRSANDWREAEAFRARVMQRARGRPCPWQMVLPL